MHVVKLEGQQLVDTDWSVYIGNSPYVMLNFPLYQTWVVHDCKLFVYHNGRILCTDGQQPVSHPFSEMFNENSERFGNIKDLAIHPTLPFGVMVEDHIAIPVDDERPDFLDVDNFVVLGQVKNMASLAWTNDSTVSTGSKTAFRRILGEITRQ